MAGVDRVRAGRKPSLDPLFRLLGGELERVNQLIVERMQSPVALIPQLAGHDVPGELWDERHRALHALYDQLIDALQLAPEQ